MEGDSCCLTTDSRSRGSCPRGPSLDISGSPAGQTFPEEAASSQVIVSNTVKSKYTGEMRFLPLCKWANWSGWLVLSESVLFLKWTHSSKKKHCFLYICHNHTNCMWYANKQKACIVPQNHCKMYE